MAAPVDSLRASASGFFLVSLFTAIAFGLAGAFWYASVMRSQHAQENADEVRFMQTCLRKQEEYVCSAMWHRGP